MNRERMLLVAILAIIALWFLAIRETPTLAGEVTTKVLPLNLLPVREVVTVRRQIQPVSPGPFTLVTNERPHKRPDLPLPAGRDLPNVWPPTSRSLSLPLLSRLRRESVPPVAGAATITLPDLGAGGGGGAGAAGEARQDLWRSFDRETRGVVTAIHLSGRGQPVREPKETPPPGPVSKDSYYRLLLLLEQQEAAQQEGIVRVEVTFAQGGKVIQNFPEEIHSFRVGVRGSQQGYLDGLRLYLSLGERVIESRQKAGGDLLQRGVGTGDRASLLWAQVILAEARKLVPEANLTGLRSILLLEIEAANRLKNLERVLELGFTHLARFPKEDEVLELVGNVMASRSFGLLELASHWLERASTSATAQRLRVEVEIRRGRFEVARGILESGRAGTGAQTDLLFARVALAQGDYATAEAKARPYSGGQDAAEASQILGGVAYAKGDASGAEQHFRKAVDSDPKRSTAYSDLGLALAVQGRSADAQLCFERAASLDFENSVVPKIGAAFLSLAGNEVGAAAGVLGDLQKDNPQDLLVRYYVGYAKERAGDLAGAAQSYRSVIDGNHRYRIAIARLGLVQARRAESGEGTDSASIKQAVAHLRKAVALNPDDVLLPYILGRFLMQQGIQARLADELFAACQAGKRPEGDRDLPFWAAAARAALLYRDDSVEELSVKSAFNRVHGDVKDLVRRDNPPDLNRAVDLHPVAQYAKGCLDMVSENEIKVDLTWSFPTRPRDWILYQKDPMRVTFEKGKGVHLGGQVNFGGQERNFVNILEFCAIEYTDVKVTGQTFFEMIWEGEIPDLRGVDVGFGVVGKRGATKEGPTGIQVRRKSNTGNADVRLDGGESELFKRMRSKDFVEMTSVPWAPGKFQVRVAVTDRDKGQFQLWLKTGEGPEVNVFGAQLGQDWERCSVFGRGRGSSPLSFYMWVEGQDGEKYEKIYLNRVTLTKSK